MKINFINLKDVDYNLQLEIRNWRNSKEVSKYFQIKYIPEDTHKQWLKKINIEESDIKAFLLKHNKTYIGLTYFMKINTISRTADWGIYIYPKDFRSKGYGKLVLEKSIKYAKDELKLEKLYLEVLENNHRAIKIYEMYGFSKLFSTNNVARYELILNNK